jgi:hypothetical protein
MYVQELSILLRRYLLYDIKHLLGTYFDRKICSTATEVSAKPLSMSVKLRNLRLRNGETGFTYTRTDPKECEAIIRILLGILHGEHV